MAFLVALGAAESGRHVALSTDSREIAPHCIGYVLVMHDERGRAGPAIELEAVLHTEQLVDVRHMLELRLGAVGDAALWAVVTATNELVTNALVHGGRCLGLRAYLLGDRVRVEVDDLSPVRIGERARRDGGLAIVGRLATAWGDEPAPRTAGGERPRSGPMHARSRSVAKTVWCEIEV